MTEPRDYFDAEDRNELVELIALLFEWHEGAERDEQYAAASCLADWLDDLTTRLTSIDAVLAAQPTEG